MQSMPLSFVQNVRINNKAECRRKNWDENKPDRGQRENDSQQANECAGLKSNSTHLMRLLPNSFTAHSPWRSDSDGPVGLRARQKHTDEPKQNRESRDDGYHKIELHPKVPKNK